MTSKKELEKLEQEEFAKQERLKEYFDSFTDYYPKVPESANVKKTGIEAQRRAVIYEVFEYFDTDHSGSMELGEIKYAMSTLGYPTKSEEIQAVLDDKGEDGSLDFDQFTDFVLSKMAQVSQEEDILRSFRLLDQDRKNFIDVQDLKRAASQIEYDMGFDQGNLKKIIEAADKDKDGRVSFEEFKQAYRKTLAQG
ncbi:MAG: putative CEN2 protein [Streblomastix strix]|uniref:Putative CEN2 protein n=1 Tax=Streblomastix strix TaxID=222440 RepID=A0A5J4WXX2_9EUKA|nr:MAG: putative CEN2 protein [Streblomastix strix]